MDDTMLIIQISQTLQPGQRNMANNLDIDSPNLFVYTIQRALVHKLHAYTNVRIGEKGAPEGYNVF